MPTLPCQNIKICSKKGSHLVLLGIRIGLLAGARNDPTVSGCVGAVADLLGADARLFLVLSGFTPEV